MGLANYGWIDFVSEKVAAFDDNKQVCAIATEAALSTVPRPAMSGNHHLQRLVAWLSLPAVLP
jgi:hypothetical protein